MPCHEQRTFLCTKLLLAPSSLALSTCRDGEPTVSSPGASHAWPTKQRLHSLPISLITRRAAGAGAHPALSFHPRLPKVAAHWALCTCVCGGCVSIGACLYRHDCIGSCAYRCVCTDLCLLPALPGPPTRCEFHLR